MYKVVFLKVFELMFIIGVLGMILKAGINRERKRDFSANGINDMIYFAGKVALIEIIFLSSFLIGSIGAAILTLF